MPYIYQSKAKDIPSDVQDEQDALKFSVDKNMDLIATWDGGEEGPFSYYINSDCELIQEV